MWEVSQIYALYSFEASATALSNLRRNGSPLSLRHTLLILPLSPPIVFTAAKWYNKAVQRTSLSAGPVRAAAVFSG